MIQVSPIQEHLVKPTHVVPHVTAYAELQGLAGNRVDLELAVINTVHAGADLVAVCGELPAAYAAPPAPGGRDAGVVLLPPRHGRAFLAGGFQNLKWSKNEGEGGQPRLFVCLDYRRDKDAMRDESAASPKGDTSCRESRESCWIDRLASVMS
jgi:hypothetical protein